MLEAEADNKMKKMTEVSDDLAKLLVCKQLNEGNIKHKVNVAGLWDRVKIVPRNQWIL